MDNNNNIKIDLINFMVAVILGLVIVSVLLNNPRDTKDLRLALRKLDAIEDSVEVAEIEITDRIEVLEEKLRKQEKTEVDFLKEQEEQIVGLLDEYDKTTR